MHHVPSRPVRRAHRRPLRRSACHRPLALLALLALVLATIGGISPASAAPADGVPVLRLDGRGHGHGVGLSQWGARSMAAAGHDAATILGHYYPGTGSGSIAGDVVVIVSRGARTMLSLPQGGELRSARDGQQAAGFPIALAPGEVVAVHHDGSGYRIERGNVRGLSSDRAQVFQEQSDCVLLCPPDEPSEPRPEPEPQPEPEPEPGDCVLCAPGEPPPPQPAPEPDAPPPGSPSSDAPRSPTPVWAVPNGGGIVHSVDRGRSYRGLLEVTGGPGQLRVRNHVDVEDYLRGMAEVPGSWPAAAVQAQTVAARTYAMRAMATGGEICDSESCQVYAGVAREHPGQDAAVAATRGWVLTHEGRLAATFYSASAGGHSANIREGFGSGYDIPYLPARPEPTDDVRPWQLEVSLRDVAARLGYPGTLTGVRVDSTGPSGRPLAMTLVGDAGERPVDPQDFRRRLGLRSTFFSAQAGLAGEAPPPPPPPMDEDQLLTAEIAAPVEATTTTTIRRADAALAAPRALPPAGTLAAARVGQAIVLALVAGLALALAGTRLRPATMGAWRSRRT